MGERGQSELVGFATVFGLVVVSIALVSATGYMGLQNLESHQELTNGERSFAVLADNVEDVTEGDVPRRATRMRLGEGTLSVEGSVEVTVTGTAVDGSGNVSVTTTLEPIVYEAGDANIVYSTGALVRVDDGRARTIREPDFVLTNETVVLPLVRTTASGNPTVGSTTALVETEQTGSKLRQTTEPYDLTLTVTSPRAAAWERTLGDYAATDCSRSGETVTCTLTTDRAVLTVDTVRVGVSD